MLIGKGNPLKNSKYFKSFSRNLAFRTSNTIECKIHLRSGVGEQWIPCKKRKLNIFDTFKNYTLLGHFFKSIVKSLVSKVATI